MNISNATSQVTYPYFKAINSDFFMIRKTISMRLNAS